MIICYSPSEENKNKNPNEKIEMKSQDILKQVPKKQTNFLNKKFKSSEQTKIRKIVKLTKMRKYIKKKIL